MTQTNFDEYANDYSGGMEHPLKRMAGGSLEDFIEPKVRWLLSRIDRYCEANGVAPEQVNLLDFGCGDGIFLRILRRLGFTGTLTGCEDSEGMLDTARERWSDGAEPEWVTLSADASVLAPGAFDFAVVSAVLHHIAVEERAGALDAIQKALKPGGRIVIFEHNPWNPVTRFVVRGTGIDHDAVLLSPMESRRLVTAAGMRVVERDYIMFLPPRMKWARKLEGLVRWLPLGGQYVVAGEK
jgi:2-polyprenyl-3-methyl-5-hydroxy-6-metoxy-1,4-benzoquinol methylase